jgi:tetratricopeptide (TPR) repeat protein
MVMDSSPPQLQISRGKARLFGAVLIALLVMVPLLAIELLVVTLGWQAPNDPYISFGRATSFFYDFEEEGVAYKTVSSRDLYRERELTFARTKPKGAFRVFFVGGSASAGWPHPDGEAYSDYLESALYRAFPDRQFEILNVSAHAYAAYRVRLILDEVLPLQPDLLVIYSGNNEFVEPRQYAVDARWFDPIGSLANRSTAYRLMRGSPFISKFFPTSTLDPEARSGTAFEQWSKIEKLPLVLRTDPGQFRKVTEHYEFSIASMVRAARDRGIPVLLLTVPTNTRDWRPNASASTAEGARSNDWRRYYRAGRAALLRGERDLAVESLTGAVELDSAHAATHYHLGRALEASGRLDEAIASYERARDLDANPFRAHSSFNEIIRRIGRTFDNVKLIDAEKLFREASAPHAPGFDLFLDYVHPTRRGNTILAKAVFDAMVASGMLGSTSAAFQFEPAPGDDGVIYDATRDQSLQRTLLFLAMMMNQNETVVRIADLIVTNPEGLGTFDAWEARMVTMAREIFREAVELERRELLVGDVLQEENDKLATRLHRLFQEIWGNYLEYRQQRGK